MNRFLLEMLEPFYLVQSIKSIYFWKYFTPVPPDTIHSSGTDCWSLVPRNRTCKAVGERVTITLIFCLHDVLGVENNSVRISDSEIRERNAARSGGNVGLTRYTQ